MTIYTTVHDIENPWPVPALGASEDEGGVAICPTCGTPVTIVHAVVVQPTIHERKPEEPDAAC